MDANERAFINARLIDPAQELDMLGTVLIRDGLIVAVGTDIALPDTAETLDCTGLALLPGLIDMQVFTGEPGEEHRETLATASQAAAAGGVTHMVVMPNTTPAIDDAALVDFISRRARGTAMVRVHPMAAITKNCEGQIMTEFGLLREAGAVAAFAAQIRREVGWRVDDGDHSTQQSKSPLKGLNPPIHPFKGPADAPGDT